MGLTIGSIDALYYFDAAGCFYFPVTRCDAQMGLTIESIDELDHYDAAGYF